jgi:hypothetical protein
MLYRETDKNTYQDFIKSLISDFQFIGSKKKDDSVNNFVPIKNISELDADYQRPTIPPAKKVANYFTNKDFRNTDISMKTQTQR